MNKKYESPMELDANVFTLALRDFEKLYENLLAKTKSKSLTKASNIVIHNFFSGIQNFVSEEMFHVIEENLSNIFAGFNQREHGFNAEDLKLLKLSFVVLECILHSEWWNILMTYEYELEKQKNSSSAINHCQRVIELVQNDQLNFGKDLKDAAPKLWACKVAYSLEHFPNDVSQNLANFKTLKRLHTDHPNRGVFSPFWEEVQSMQMRIERGLSPTSVRGKLSAM